jgi:hypothetical protein
MVNTHWLEPAPLWGERPLNTLGQPRLLEMENDDFLSEFLNVMQPCGANPQTITSWLEAHALPGQGTGKLYQPLHGRFYLVTASLICRETGLPERFVNLKAKQRTDFVVRRLPPNGGEEAWQEGVGWVAAPLGTDGKPAFVDGEERFPVHGVTVCTREKGQTGLQPCERKVYYGYVAVGNREKYEQPASPPPGVNVNQPVIEQVKGYFAGIGVDYRKSEYEQRIGDLWQDMQTESAKIGDAALKKTYINETSLTILLNFGEYLMKVMPETWNAIQLNVEPATGDRRIALFRAVSPFRFTHYGVVDKVTIGAVLREPGIKATVEKIVAGQDFVLPGAEILNYDLATAPIVDANENVISTFPMPSGSIDWVKSQVFALLDSTTELPVYNLVTDPRNLLAMFRKLIKPRRVDANDKPIEDRFIIRMVYDYDHECPPIMSEASREFTYARFFDPDAPPRMVRVEMPSIKPGDLRKYSKGVGIQMSNDLNQLLDRLHPGMLKGEGLNPATGSPPPNTFGMVCTFSIQIITLVALIVMFIFLILLNIVFWWLAFLRICLPIPKSN